MPFKEKEENAVWFSQLMFSITIIFLGKNSCPESTKQEKSSNIQGMLSR